MPNLGRRLLLPTESSREPATSSINRRDVTKFMRVARIGNFFLGSSDSKFRRWRSFKGEALARERMAKLELPRVQHMPRKAAASAIQWISQHRAAQMLQVHPDLMRASRARTAFDQADAACRCEHAIFGNCFPAASEGRHSHLLAVHGIASDGRVDNAAAENAVNPQPKQDRFLPHRDWQTGPRERGALRRFSPRPGSHLSLCPGDG